MLLTVTTTHQPATDLGFLLHKHPGRARSFDVASGTAHVFYPEASDERCTAALLLDVDPVALVRGPGDDLFLWLFVLLFGGSQGSRGPMISTLATLRYRGANFGRIYGLIGVGMGLGGFFGAWIGGVLHDLTGGYATVLVFSLCSISLASMPFWTVPALRNYR